MIGRFQGKLRQSGRSATAAGNRSTLPAQLFLNGKTAALNVGTGVHSRRALHLLFLL
jgi:hypothetical protein